MTRAKKKKGGKKSRGADRMTTGHEEMIEFCNYMAQLQIFSFQVPPPG